MWISTRMAHTSLPESTQSDSVSMARLSRRPRSTTRPSSTADSAGRPGSKEGSAMGENSVKMEREPSLGLSLYGLTSWAETKVTTWVWPKWTSAEPSCLASLMVSLRWSEGRRPSTRRSDRRAASMNLLSLRGIRQLFASLCSISDTSASQYLGFRANLF
ncbi:hypothetical protein VIGAN_10228800 [Vigna angularis var. angularis]|uniref:Uncharacterized protein n=1 Tax=Vigna angularis var. angularis TaxID=157739 RepID=A0A0S3T6W9_PHAAN|nr:hypothetical protein VIGAN_10228800 [Vigna angularis var. angularis]